VKREEDLVQKTDVKIKDHIYDYEQIVIGGDLNAILYAYKTNSVLICNTHGCTFPFDKTDHDITLGTLNFPRGSYKRDIRNILIYDMSLQGRVPYGDTVASLTIDQTENKISVFKNFSRVNFSRFSNLRIFDLNNINGIEYDPVTVVGNRVFDWFDVRSGMKHKYDALTDESNFCRNIHFYLSWRIDGNHDKKDLVCESWLNDEQLRDIDYSDSISRLKVIKMMQQAGIKGTGNGQGRWLPIKIELWKREIFPVIEFDYFEKDNIVIDNRTVEDVLLEG